MKLVSSILIFAFSLVLTQKLFIYVNYLQNKTYYATELCVNKDEPESCCEGKCELKKELDALDSQSGELATTSNKDSNPKTIKYEKNEETFLSYTYFLVWEENVINISTNYQVNYPTGQSTELDYPPQLTLS